MKFGLHHLRHFIAVAEELHFRRAAERLGIAQPALSRSIKTLEGELGVDLFIRSNRNVRITEAGKAFLEGCRGVMTAIETTVDRTRRVQLGTVGTLRVGYTDMAIAGPLPQLMKSFQDREPEIGFRPKHDVTSAQLKKLVAGELDFGFVTGPIERSDFRQLPVSSERLVCVVYETHPLATLQSVRMEDLAEEDFVLGSSSDWAHFQSYLLPLCRRSGFVPRVVQEAFNTAGILGLVACGMGLTILTESVCNPLARGLKVIPFADVDEQVETVAVWKLDENNGPKRRFEEYLLETHPGPCRKSANDMT